MRVAVAALALALACAVASAQDLSTKFKVRHTVSQKWTCKAHMPYWTSQTKARQNDTGVFYSGEAGKCTRMYLLTHVTSYKYVYVCLLIRECLHGRENADI